MTCGRTHFPRVPCEHCGKPTDVRAATEGHPAFCWRCLIRLTLSRWEER